MRIAFALLRVSPDASRVDTITTLPGTVYLVSNPRQGFPNWDSQPLSPFSHAMAVEQRQPRQVIHHSDQGTQYTSIAFGQRCKQLGVRPSMGSVGDAYDNAMCESFFATLECELIDLFRFRTQAEARIEVFDFIEGFYNPRRRHSGLGQISPATFERAQRAAA